MMGWWERIGGWPLVALLVVVSSLCASTGRAQRTYLVVGGGFATLGGDAIVSDSRGSGWGVEGAVRREIRENLLVGVSGAFYRSNIDADEFFASREVFLPAPDDHLRGGEASIFAAALEGIYERPVDRSTVIYGKMGAGLYTFSTSTIVTDAEQLELEQIPSSVIFEDESVFGGYVGAGARFPLGESGGIWIEFDVHFAGATGGEARIVPVTVGFSIP